MKHDTQIKPQIEFGKPGGLAMSRHQAGGNIYAGNLLHYVKLFFDPKYEIKKFSRQIKGDVQRDWIFMSRLQWARGAGLSEAEMKNAALPNLRKRDFITIRTMRLSGNDPKTLWISLDPVKLAEATMPSDMLPFFPVGEKWIGNEGAVLYPHNAAK